MSEDIIKFKVEVYPVVGTKNDAIRDGKKSIIQYRWKLVNEEGEALCMDPETYDTSEQSYLAGLKTRWIMGNEGLPMVLVDEEGNPMPDEAQKEMREEATLLLRKLNKENNG